MNDKLRKSLSAIVVLGQNPTFVESSPALSDEMDTTLHLYF
jgi:hypothetical protein